MRYSIQHVTEIYTLELIATSQPAVLNTTTIYFIPLFSRMAWPLMSSSRRRNKGPLSPQMLLPSRSAGILTESDSQLPWWYMTCKGRQRSRGLQPVVQDQPLRQLERHQSTVLFGCAAESGLGVCLRALLLHWLPPLLHRTTSPPNMLVCGFQMLSAKRMQGPSGICTCPRPPDGTGRRVAVNEQMRRGPLRANLNKFNPRILFARLP